MPLENLVGNKFISDLNANWPAGTDLPDAGDDHLRGIKNVLQKSFPAVTGPVTLTQDQINRGSVPAGAVLPFFMAAAPVGWTRSANFTQTFGMRIVPTADAGGVSGGTDDPILMNKVPSHVHGFSGVSGANSVDHSHGFSGTTGFMNQNTSHNHGVNDPGHVHQSGFPNNPSLSASGGAYAGAWQGPTAAAQTGISINGTDTNHTHNLSGNTGGQSQAHTHTIAGDSATNTGAANWVPRYVDMIMCVRDAA